MNQITEKIKEIAKKITDSFGLEIIDVTYRRERSGRILRVIIDAPGGVNVEDCAKVSRELNNALDVEDIFEDKYYLEVSSPGINKPLLKMEDFKSSIGKRVKIKLHKPQEGAKNLSGQIRDIRENLIILQVDNNDINIDFSNIKYARLDII